ncbi:hypothetical protein [Nocardia arizonensis]|uniref:hypothetical protein n=1 Tax=Nocardia arizonensis TaxID=1141647 RepID=UPI0006D1A186|nr:hypothetical protein [Nocardia arizonensis]
MCYTLSEEFQTVYNPLQTALLETGGMAGGYQAVKAWSKAYDERAAAMTLVATNFARALQHFGDVLAAAGYNWAVGEYKANRDPKKGDPPTLPAVPSELPYGANSVIGVAASGTNSRGLESEIPDLYDKVTAKVAGGEIPDGDTVKLARAATAWKTFAESTPAFGARTRLKMAADGLERGYGSNVPQDIPYLVAHLRTLATSAGEIELAAHDLAAATDAHNVALAAMRTEINTQFAMAVVGASVVIAAAVVMIKKPQMAGGAEVEATTLDTAAVAMARTIGTFFTSLNGITFTSAALATRGLATIAGLSILIASIDDSSNPDRYENLPEAAAIPLGGLTDAAENYIREKHVDGNHTADTDPDKSTFKPDQDLDDLVDRAENITARGPNKYGNYEREVDAGQDVGQSGGRSTSRYKVITDKWGTVVNMFPIP